MLTEQRLDVLSDLLGALSRILDQGIAFLARFVCITVRAYDLIYVATDLLREALQLKGQAPADLLPFFRRDQHADGESRGGAKKCSPNAGTNNISYVVILHVRLVQRLASFLLVAVLTQPLLTLVRSDLVTFPFSSAGHVALGLCPSL